MLIKKTVGNIPYTGSYQHIQHNQAAKPMGRDSLSLEMMFRKPSPQGTLLTGSSLMVQQYSLHACIEDKSLNSNSQTTHFQNNKSKLTINP